MPTFGSDFNLTGQSAFGSDFNFDVGVVDYSLHIPIRNTVFDEYSLSIPIRNTIVYNEYVLAIAIRNTVFDEYSLSIPIRNTIHLAYSLSIPVRNTIIYRDYALVIPIRNTVFDKYSLSIPVRNTIIYRDYALVIPIRNTVFAPYSLSIPIRNTINAPVLGNVWQAVIMLDGVDMSARQSGRIRVSMSEDSARLAHFELMPFSGAIDPYQWIGVAVSIDYVTYDSAGVMQSAHRLFTGKVNEPIYDPVTRFTSFECTDGLQESLELLDKNGVDLMVGGYHSDTVFSETEDLWLYAQQRLSTIPASYDCDVNGQGRLTLWQPKSVADATFGVGTVIHESLGLKLISRRDIVNTVNINFSYRYGREWHREIGAMWNYDRPFFQFLSDQTFLPNRAMILSALSSAWDIKSISFTKLPQTGVYTNSEGSQTVWSITEELRDYLVFGASFTLSKNWLQDITESYSIEVTCDASIAQHGEVKATETYSIDEPVDEAIELASDAGSIVLSSSTDSDIETGKTFGLVEPGVSGVDIDGQNNITDPSDRTDVDNAITTAINEARVQILKSHRANTLVIQTLLSPLVDVSKTVAVVTPGVTATGKARFVEHIMDSSTGEAISLIEASLYLPNTVGQVDDAATVPATPDTLPVPELKSISLNTYVGGRTTVPYSEDWNGFITNWTGFRTFPSEWYPIEFRVDIPAVEDAARDAQEFNALSSYNVAIPQDTLTIN
ncbi:MAG: hypothetical protein COB22_07895 [Cycloclasticus sp.]|nr:MAG: hypothetical protein COB22_07895 [Cycloclasticus sp.]